MTTRVFEVFRLKVWRPCNIAGLLLIFVSEAKSPTGIIPYPERKAPASIRSDRGEVSIENRINRPMLRYPRMIYSA
jgi:hypothetical protein